jgi:Ca2+-transporting ATPase
VAGSGYQTSGKFSKRPENLNLLLMIGVLCNDSKIENKKCIGDPTEGSLLISAQKAKIDTDTLKHEHPRLNEVPFSCERKRMTTVHKIDGKYFAYMKGAPEVILNLCSSDIADGRITALTREKKDRVLHINHEFSGDALKVIGFAFKQIRDPRKFKEADEKDFVFVGLQGMIDPPRDEVETAIEECHDAEGKRSRAVWGIS